MDHSIEHLSKFLYVGLCKKIGFPTQVSIRRDVIEMGERVQFLTDTEFRRMVSGSRREGFNLPTSDIDTMYWHTDQKVICDLRQTENYPSPGVTLILMKCSERPGFALLQLITPSYNHIVAFGCFRLNDGIYISSSKFRHLTLQQRNDHSFFIHGPCITHRDCQLEFDSAYCLSSRYWPQPAMSWIERCQQSTWPPSPVVQDILNNGFHLVPIGGKYSPLEDHEWRISFSQAEQKLVYSMNHVQFLCYGLLKLFLKEVINVNEENPPLCSYFMKTVVFWEVQQKRNQTWTPNSILNHFWQCFKRIIHWVRSGECPNFFISSYNMFYGKVVGSVQYSLLTKLQDLYSMGVSCLLLCDSVRSHMTYAVYNSTMSISTNELHFVGETDFEMELYHNNFFYIGHVSTTTSLLLRYIETIETLTQSPHSRYQTIVLQSVFSKVLQNLVVNLHSTTCISANNKQLYMSDVDRLSCRLLKLAAKFGNVTDLLYISMYYYKTHRHSMALRYAELTKYKLSRPYLWYNGRVRKGIYSEIVGRRSTSLSSKVRETVASTLDLPNTECHIDELKLEQKISKGNKHFVLTIPPFVMVNMLIVLCYHGDPHKQLEALHDLHTLLTNDHDQIFTDDQTRDISWQILGICYQIHGDYQNALQAYQKSLNQNPRNKIQEASHIRISYLMEAQGSPAS